MKYLFKFLLIITYIMYLSVVNEIIEMRNKESESQDSNESNKLQEQKIDENNDNLKSNTNNNVLDINDIFNKFLCYISGSAIDIEDLREYDFFEKYDETKTYEKERYFKDYGKGEREYENILYSSYVIYDSGLGENAETNNNEEHTKLKKQFVVAKEIYKKEELKQLEKYCDCYNCKELKKYENLCLYDSILDYLIRGLIMILSWIGVPYKTIHYLRSCLKINLICGCCCGCIKCGSGYASVTNITKARNILYGDRIEKMNKIKVQLKKMEELKKKKNN